VPGERLRLEAYKKLAAVQTDAGVEEIRSELADRYGALPPPVENLLEVARLRVTARRAGLADVGTQGQHVRLGPLELRESQQLRLTRLYPGSLVKPAVRTVLVPRPKTAAVGGQPLRDRAVLDWARQLIEAVLLDDMAAAATVASST
jgi:transcription-repair coupling factor (superfamily II helicase)